jgi:restriction endonuclease S subunit
VKWSAKPVSEIAQHSLGKMLDKTKNQGTPRPYLRNLNVRWFEFDLSNVFEMRFLDSEASRFTAIRGDVLICEGGYPGRAAIWDGDQPIYFQKAIHRVRFHERQRNKWFVYYLYYLDATGQLKQYFSGTGIQHFTGETLARLPVPLPPLPEQQRIVGILDEAFACITTAKANAEKNLRNARALFESELQDVFNRRSDGWVETQLGKVAEFKNGLNFNQSSRGQSVRLVGVGDFRRNYDVPTTALQSVTIDDRLDENYEIREGDLLTVRSNGSQDLVGRCMLVPTIDEVISYSGFVIRIRCDTSVVLPRFLLHFMKSSATRERLTRDGGGANISNINQGKLAALNFPVPPRETQQAVVQKLDRLVEETDRLESVYERKNDALDALKKSLLHQAFTGQLRAKDSPVEPPAVVIPFSVTIANISTTDLHAGILAIACQRHEAAGRLGEFTHVKAEKIAHMVEARLGIDLGRKPVKDAAGPNDFNHLKKVEHRAKKTNAFDFKRVEGGAYRVQKLYGFNCLVEKTRTALGDRVIEVEDLLDWMLPMNVRQAEIVATVYAAWNNLLLDGKTPTDEEIVFESRENWHAEKFKIERWRFVEAVGWLRKEGVVPQGKGKRVEKRRA